MSEARITRPAKQRLQKASRKPIEAYFDTLPRHERNQKWLRVNNRYRVDCIRRYADDLDSNRVDDTHLVSYVAASGPAHVIDSWSYLSRAIEATLRGDTYSAIHLSYYAELRAAIALLACEGVGIFNNRHPVIDQIRRTHRLPKGQTRNDRTSTWQDRYLGTHAVVWPTLEHWSGLKPAGDLLEEAVRPENIPLADWLGTSGHPIPTRQVAKRWLLWWGLDLRIFDDDHNTRNLVSYRPSEFRRPSDLDAAKLVEFIEELWNLFEPGNTRRFPVLERFLVRRTLREAGLPAPSPSALEGIGLDPVSASKWAGFLSNTDDPLPFQLAEGRGTVEDPFCHLQIISRAALLLYLATCAARRLLLNASYNASTLEFWWKRHGASRGLWEAEDCPADPTELWADIEASLRDARQWRLGLTCPGSLKAFRRDLTTVVGDFGGFELVGMWGLIP